MADLTRCPGGGDPWVRGGSPIGAAAPLSFESESGSEAVPVSIQEIGSRFWFVWFGFYGQFSWFWFQNGSVSGSQFGSWASWNVAIAWRGFSI